MFTEKVSDKNWQVNKSRNIISFVINQRLWQLPKYPPSRWPAPLSERLLRKVLILWHQSASTRQIRQTVQRQYTWCENFSAGSDSGVGDADMGAWAASHIAPCYWLPTSVLSLNTLVHWGVYWQSSHAYYRRSHRCSSPLSQHSYYEHTLTFTADNLQMCTNANQEFSLPLLHTVYNTHLT